MLRNFQDRIYREAEGLYIVLDGHVDVVSTREKGNKIFQVDLLEAFGRSSFLPKVDLEYTGDIYAGFL
jgi:hypothetical protein